MPQRTGSSHHTVSPCPYGRRQCLDIYPDLYEVGRRAALTAALTELGTMQSALPWTTLQQSLPSGTPPLIPYSNLGLRCPIVSELYICSPPPSHSSLLEMVMQRLI